MKKKTQPWRSQLPPELQAIIDKDFSGNAKLYDDFNHLWFSTLNHIHAIVCASDYGRHEGTTMKLARKAMTGAFFKESVRAEGRYRKSKQFRAMFEKVWGEGGIHERILKKNSAKK
jgi:hypothetical protein